MIIPFLDKILFFKIISRVLGKNLSLYGGSKKTISNKLLNFIKLISLIISFSSISQTLSILRSYKFCLRIGITLE